MKRVWRKLSIIEMSFTDIANHIKLAARSSGGGGGAQSTSGFFTCGEPW